MRHFALTQRRSRSDGSGRRAKCSGIENKFASSHLSWEFRTMEEQSWGGQRFKKHYNLEPLQKWSGLIFVIQRTSFMAISSPPGRVIKKATGWRLPATGKPNTSSNRSASCVPTGGGFKKAQGTERRVN